MALDERFLAVGDIHGCPDQLEEILDLGRALPHHRWVFLGDYINRGPDSERVVRRLMALDAVFLLGNHEERLLRNWSTAETAADRRRWLDATGLSADSIEWLASVPLPVFETEAYLFVHDAALAPPTSKWIVHGHVPVEAPEFAERRINLNTRCGVGGPLTAIALPETVLLQSSPSPRPSHREPAVPPLLALADEELEELALEKPSEMH